MNWTRSKLNWIKLNWIAIYWISSLPTGQNNREDLHKRTETRFRTRTPYLLIQSHWNVLNWIALFFLIWWPWRYCGEPCTRCLQPKCKKQYARKHDRLSTVCYECENPACANCGVKYTGAKAFRGKDVWFCDKPLCRKQKNAKTNARR